MKSCLLVLALLQALGCSGIPLYTSEVQDMANQGLGAALAQVNSAYTISRLYRVTRASISRIVPMGLNTVDLLMTFGIKETECVKGSTNDTQTCAFRPGFFVPTFLCFSRVRASADSAQVVSLSCGQDGSSSSESSEEIFSRGRHQLTVPFANRVPAPSAPSPPPPPPPPSPPLPVNPGRSFQGSPLETQPRGDTFTNYLV